MAVSLCDSGSIAIKRLGLVSEMAFYANGITERLVCSRVFT